MTYKYSFIGVGNMARALISAITSLEGKLRCEPSDVFLYDKNESRTAEFNGLGYNIARTIDEAVENANFIFLCVKPQNYREVLEYIKISGISLEHKTLVSVAAGISTSQICDCLGLECAVIRTMPNTPMTIGLGVCAVCRNKKVETKDFERICRILSSKAELLMLDESQMNNIIGITSSSPAYVYKFIDSLLSAAKAQGLDSPKMLEIICKVMIGSAQMVLNSDKSVKDLISAVRSPNGTTERALAVFDAHGFEETVLDAVDACNRRADTLGEEM